MILTTPYLPHCRSETVNGAPVNVDPSFTNLELGVGDKLEDDHQAGNGVNGLNGANMPPPSYAESVGVQTHESGDDAV